MLLDGLGQGSEARDSCQSNQFGIYFRVSHRAKTFVAAVCDRRPALIQRHYDLCGRV